MRKFFDEPKITLRRSVKGSADGRLKNTRIPRKKTINRDIYAIQKNIRIDRRLGPVYIPTKLLEFELRRRAIFICRFCSGSKVK